MSSTCWAVLANSSLTSMPLWPYRANLNGDRIARAGLALGAQVGAGQRLAVVLVEQRLGIERVDLRRPAVHEQVHDPLCLAGEVRLLVAPAPRHWLRGGRRRQRSVGRQHAGQAEHAKTRAAAAQHLAPESGGPLASSVEWLVHQARDARQSINTNSLASKIACADRLPAGFGRADAARYVGRPLPVLRRPAVGRSAMQVQPRELPFGGRFAPPRPRGQQTPGRLRRPAGCS